MSDLDLLFIVLAFLYAWECACWFRHGSVAFRTWLGRRWRMVYPDVLLGNRHGGFLLAAPLPPLGGILSVTRLPLSLSSEAVFAWVAPELNSGWRPPPPGGVCRLDQIQTARADGKKVLINGAPLLKTSSPAFARHLARMLEDLKKTPAAAREDAIGKLFRGQFDTEAIRQRWQAFQKQNGPLRPLTNALFLYLFALAPMLIWQLGLRRSWLGLLVGLLLLTLSTAIFFRRAHRALYPEAEDERFTHFLTILLSPATAIRAQDILSRQLLETFHPLAVAQVFCPKTAFRSQAGKVLLEQRFPALPASASFPAEVAAVERSSRALLGKTVETFLVRNGINPEDLVPPPAPADETCRSYCPRCRAQYTPSEGTCPDCGGLALIAFGKSSAGQVAGK